MKFFITNAHQFRVSVTFFLSLTENILIDFRERGRGRKERERNISVSLLPKCISTGDETCNTLVPRMIFQPTEPPGQGAICDF